jgi:apolipoprotein N-acyltransferase
MRLTGTLRFLLATLSGLMLTACFPPGKLSYVAWFALIPLLKSVEHTSPGQAFRLGFVAGMAHYLTLIYWIMEVLGRYGGLSTLLSLGPFLLLCAYLALFPASFAALMPLFRDKRLAVVQMACIWVGLEFIRARLFTGFPWCLLGYSQYAHVHLIQVADLFGVYALSFLILLCNGLLYALLSAAGTRQMRARVKWEALLAAAALVGLFLYGDYRLRQFGERDGGDRTFKVSIIQANIDQSLKWKPAYQDKTMATYLRLTLDSAPGGPDIILWPETAVPFFFQDNLKYAPLVLSVVHRIGKPLIFGSPAYKELDGRTTYFNRAYLLTPDKAPIQYYDKVHLVPFGEYVPLKRFLFFVERLVPAAGDFGPGDKMVPLRHEDFAAGILICYEAIFPEHARSHARSGANLLVNLTNDAWFGMTSAPYQHLVMAVFRAVENRMPLLRAANTGFSAYVGPDGRIQALSRLFTEQILTAEPCLVRSNVTFYTRFGDVFALLILLCAAIRMVWLIIERRS